jgi:tRNA pseudouridine65 synthase
LSLPIPILFEDDYIIIANKPNDVLVHHSYYSRNITDDSLLQLLAQQGLGKLYPVNRLDRKTSGIILLCKRKEDVSIFQELFTNKSITKKYKALVRGHILEGGIIDSPVKNERDNYKEAESHFSPIELYHLDIAVKPYPSARYTLLEFSPITGRTHQLRIHANKIAHPIVGDHKHGNRHHNKMFEEQLNLPKLFLHSYHLSFMHPVLKNKVCIEVAVPDFWNSFFNHPKCEKIKIPTI